MIKTICINCGSSYGNSVVYRTMARQLGEFLADNDITIVYGGAQAGLMKEVADASLHRNGKVIGVITQYINQKVGHKHLTELYVVSDMHERKMKMFELSDAFIALPGGYGTLEEIMEIITWAQLGYHRKPFGFLNVNSYYDTFFEFIDHAVCEGFIKQVHKDMIIVENTIPILIEKLNRAILPDVDKWIYA